MRIEQTGDEQPAPVRSHAVAFHQQLGGPFERDGTPDGGAYGVHRQRDLRDLGPELREPIDALLDLRIDLALGVRMPETLGNDADAEPSRILPEGGGVLGGTWCVLPWVEAVIAGDDLEEQRVVGNGPRHRPRVVEGQLDGHDAGVRDQTMGRLHAVDAAERGGYPDRPPLIAAEGHIDLAGGYQSRGP